MYIHIRGFPLTCRNYRVETLNQNIPYYDTELEALLKHFHIEVTTLGYHRAYPWKGIAVSLARTPQIQNIPSKYKYKYRTYLPNA